VSTERPVIEVARYVVGEAVWAPSVHNTQPWWFSVGPSGLGLYADPARQLTVADPVGREMLISCGAALFTARLALRAAGYVPETRILPDPVRPLLLASLGWRPGPAATAYERRLYAQIRQRRSHRGGFAPLPVAPELLTLLREAAGRHGAALHVITDEGIRYALAEVVQASERALQMDGSRVRERSSWTAPPGCLQADGVPVTAYPARAEWTSPYFPSPDFAHGRGWGHTPLSIVPGRSAGVVCLLETSSDEPGDWIGAGQALQRILLACTAWGVAVALHSQPFELGWGHDPVPSRPAGGLCPQMLLRIGTTTQTAGGIRRPPESVLFAAGERSG